MNVIFDRGIYLADLDAWLDGRVKRAQGFISHAHSDHVARHVSAVLTPATRLLLGPLLKKSECRTLEYHEPLSTSNYTMTLYPAGHCLGSAQALIESRATGERVLYTGDIKLRPNVMAEPAEVVHCDTLIIECNLRPPGVPVSAGIRRAGPMLRNAEIVAGSRLYSLWWSPTALAKPRNFYTIC